MGIRAADAGLLARLPTLGSGLDRALAWVSRAADRSLLWMGVAGLVAIAAPGRGPRAAAQGLVSLGVASALVNGPLKLLSRRRRPADVLELPIAPWVRRPVTYSFPSGHTASAFAFATGTVLELPRAAVPLALLAGAVGYSRVHTRVHYPSDVLAGAVLGAAIGIGTRQLVPIGLAAATQRLERRRADLPSLEFDHVVLVVSPNAGRAAKELPKVRGALESAGLRVVKELHVGEVGELGRMLDSFSGQTLVIAAGGDGTVGAVANALANGRAVMGVIPLGTSNDFARSLHLPMRVRDAAGLFRRGKVSTIDLGRLEAPDRPHLHFVHAATAGINVNFAKLATRASFRRRLGRLTYAAAAAVAVEQRSPFQSRLVFESGAEELRLTQLSIINAPVFGGFLGMRMRDSSLDDRLLDVLAVEDVPLHTFLLAALHAAFGLRRPLRGIRAFHLRRMDVHTDPELEVALDGEVAGKLPATFAVAGEALRVVTPYAFEHIDEG